MNKKWLYTFIIVFIAISACYCVDFGVVVRENSDYYILNTDLSVAYQGTWSQEWFAAAPDSHCIYVNEAGVLTRRSTDDGSVEYTTTDNVAGSFRPFVVDGDGNVWCYIRLNYKLVKYNSNLTTSKVYTLHRGTGGDLLGGSDTIETVSMSFDGKYVAIVNHNFISVAVYDTSKLETEAGAEWVNVLGYHTCHNTCFDDSNNVYVSSYGGGDLTRLKYSDGSTIWQASSIGYGDLYSYFLSYSYADTSIYCGGDGDKNFVLKLVPWTGATKSYTSNFNCGVHSTLVASDSFLYSGSGTYGASDTKLRKWKIGTNEWIPSGTVTCIDSFYVADDSYYTLQGDCTGYIHKKIAGLSTVSEGDGSTPTPPTPPTPSTTSVNNKLKSSGKYMWMRN